MNATLMKHQSDAIDFALKNNGVAAFYWEVGCGKTLAALATFAELRKKEPRLKMLVICPLSLIYGAWTREIEKFTDYNWFDYHDKKQRKRRPAEADIYIINFEYLTHSEKYLNIRALLKSYIDTPWMGVVDECSRMKNHKALTTERILKLRPYLKCRIIMSGTPAPNIEWEYFEQMHFLSDEILGLNFYRFRNIYFSLQRRNQLVSPGLVLNAFTIRKLHEQGFKYEIIPHKREEMLQRMKPWCFWIAAKDCIDLPEEADEYRIVEMTQEQSRVYKHMKKDYIAKLEKDGSYATANIVLTKLLRLCQITSGFVTNNQNQPESVCLNKNPKIEALLDIVEESKQEQIIIWCQFHWEIDAVVNNLLPLGGVSELHGRIPESQRNEMLDNFLNGKNRFLVAHPLSAAHGLTLTNCHLVVFFSLNYSMEAYSQARGRIYRKGQKNNCLYFHLLARDTIDEDILGIVQKKETALDFARRFVKNEIGIDAPVEGNQENQGEIWGEHQGLQDT